MGTYKYTLINNISLEIWKNNASNLMLRNLLSINSITQPIRNKPK